MAETAGGTGTAGQAEAVTGQAMPPHLELAAALADADHAEQVIAQVRGKLAKAREDAGVLVADAEQALADVEAEAVAKRARLAGLAADPATVEALREDAERARALYKQAQQLAADAEG